MTWFPYLLPFFFLDRVCANALPAADLEALLVRPSESVFEAAEAAFLPVCFFGAPVCDNALAAADLDFLPVDLEVSVFEAFLATDLLVTLLFLLAISFSHQKCFVKPARCEQLHLLYAIGVPVEEFEFLYKGQWRQAQITNWFV